MSVVTWQYAADEIREEARCRGDLDERTVNALVVWLERLGHGYVESNLARKARAVPDEPARYEPSAESPLTEEPS